MTFHDRDLLHRRPTAATTSIRRTSDMNGKHMRRKKRISHKQRTMLIAAAAAAGTLMIITLTFVRKGNMMPPSNGSNSNPSANWKPRLKKSLAVSLMNNNDEKASASRRAHINKLQIDQDDLYRYKFSTEALGYDIYNCPEMPPEDYPRAWPVTDIISNWNPNEVTTIAPKYREVYHSLCIFDYQSQYKVALAYRDAEKPFVSSTNQAI